MKRQRGRNRGNKPQQHNANRAFDSNGPEGIKVRGNAQHVYDKYQQLARDAAGSGDRVLAENYLQHAEHYFRLIRAIQPHRSVSDIVGRDAYSSGLDIDFEDESNRNQPPPQQDGDQNQGQGGNQGGDNTSGDGGDRNDGDQRRGRGRNRNRRDRDNNNDDRQGGNDERRARDNRDDDDQGDKGEGKKDPLAVVEPESTPLPRSREKSGGDDDGPRLRSSEGDESHAPAFLKAPSRAKSSDEGGEKPRRSRKSEGEKSPADAD